MLARNRWVAGFLAAVFVLALLLMWNPLAVIGSNWPQGMLTAPANLRATVKNRGIFPVRLEALAYPIDDPPQVHLSNATIVDRAGLVHPVARYTLSGGSVVTIILPLETSGSTPQTIVLLYRFLWFDRTLPIPGRSVKS